MNSTHGRIVALDIGTRRIGVASASRVARLATPITTLSIDEDVDQTIAAIKTALAAETASEIVVGLPRSLEGNDTDQTKLTRDFVKKLKKQVNLPVYWQDEAVTSRLSEDSLKAKGKPFQKGAIDALAASYILEDYLADKQQVAA